MCYTLNLLKYKKNILKHLKVLYTHRASTISYLKFDPRRGKNKFVFCHVVVFFLQLYKTKARCQFLTTNQTMFKTKKLKQFKTSPSLYVSPLNPTSHPFTQDPLMWSHCFESRQSPHVSLHPRPYPFSHSNGYKKTQINLNYNRQYTVNVLHLAMYSF